MVNAKSIGSHHRATQGTNVHPPTTIHSPKLRAYNPQSKLASQIVTKRCQIQWWFVLTE